MKLTELFTSDRQITDNSKTQPQTNSAQNTSLINRQIRSLAPGQTIQGELVSKNGGEVQIKLSEDMTIRARVDQNMNLEVGKTMTFEVKNNGQSLVLSPLFENVATDANVLKALHMASISVNQDTVSMTEQMMQAGLSIDRNSLLQVFRESNLYPSASIGDIIDLHKMSMPVNEGNLEQLTSYKNLTHQLTDGLANCMESIPGALEDMLQSGHVEGAAKLYQELLNMIGGLAEEGSGMPSTGNGQLSAASMENAGVLSPGENGQGAGDGNTASKLPNAISGQEGIVENAPGWNAEGSVLTKGLPQAGDVLLDMLHHAEGASQQAAGNAGESVGEGMDAAAIVPNQNQGGSTGTALLQELTNVLQQHPQAEKYQEITAQLGRLSQGDGNWQEVTDAFHKLLSQGLQNQDGALLRSLLGNKELQGMVKEGLQRLWSIRPEEVADAEKVEELYSRLNRQIKGLMQTLESVGQTHSEAYQATGNLSHNLDFLQQMNQTYAYMQLPLRLQQGRNANGELFVYTNKKHLAAKDGTVSALLHLDMENLGPVDVYVAMQNEKVNTKFYVQDDGMLDFLMEHMDILTARLQKRGYSCTCEMQVRNTEEKQESVVTQVLKQEKQIPMVHYAFDVRT